jgi:hypothetical protein
MSLTKLSLGGNYDVIYKLFLPRESLVSDIPAGYGNIEKLYFYSGQDTHQIVRSLENNAIDITKKNQYYSTEPVF